MTSDACDWEARTIDDYPVWIRREGGQEAAFIGVMTDHQMAGCNTISRYSLVDKSQWLIEHVINFRGFDPIPLITYYLNDASHLDAVIAYFKATDIVYRLDAAERAVVATLPDGRVLPVPPGQRLVVWRDGAVRFFDLEKII